MYCATCPFHLDQIRARVRVHIKPWGASPNLWLGGAVSDLLALQLGGLATKDPAGWWIPTDLF